MQEQKNIIDCYNKTAQQYADAYGDELDHKHFDRILLSAFADENRGKGKLIDLGCGPGQTTGYLSGCGMHNLLGTDISPEMVRVAKKLHPQLNFEVADMLSLHYPDAAFASAAGFYSIVHFDYEQIKTAFNQINRILTANGQFLFSFHIGDDVVHRDEFLEQQVNIDFYFFDPEKIKMILLETGFEIIDLLQRQFYEGVEFPSKRAYIWVKKI